MPLNAKLEIAIPQDITVTINKRKVTVCGKRGKLERDFGHCPLDMAVEGDKISITTWFPRGAQKGLPRTIGSHIENMFTGVTKGFEYKMRFAYAHFPISSHITDNNSVIEIRNFMHDILTRRVSCPEGVTVRASTDVKDEIVLTGNSIEDVSRTAARIHESLKVRNKDIRKFLDGCYVSARGTVEKE